MVEWAHKGVLWQRGEEATMIEAIAGRAASDDGAEVGGEASTRGHTGRNGR